MSDLSAVSVFPSFCVYLCTNQLDPEPPRADFFQRTIKWPQQNMGSKHFRPLCTIFLVSSSTSQVVVDPVLQEVSQAKTNSILRDWESDRAVEAR